MAALDNRTEILSVVEKHLRKAGINERLPTPVDELVAAAGLTEDPDYALTDKLIKQMPKWMAKHLRTAQRKVAGLIDRRERIISVDESLRTNRKKFVKLHELTHDILPWQRDLLAAGDTNLTLSPLTERRFEQEANQGAADLYFQGDLLTRIAKDYSVDISTPLILANMFGASPRATFRYWVDTQSHCACGIVIEDQPEFSSGKKFQRYECTMSENWQRQFGQAVFPRKMSVLSFPFLAALIQGYDVDEQWTLPDVNQMSKELRVQSFSNGYQHFILVWLPGTESFLARHRKSPIIQLNPTSQITNIF